MFSSFHGGTLGTTDKPCAWCPGRARLVGSAPCSSPRCLAGPAGRSQSPVDQATWTVKRKPRWWIWFSFCFFVFKKRSVTLERIWESPWATELMGSVTLCDAGTIISSFLYRICFSLGKIANDNLFFRLFLVFFIFRNATCPWSFAAKSERRGETQIHRWLATNE